MKPIIYITATPIGSLADISAHARDILSRAELIICEDTRSTQHLLHACGIKNRNLESLHAHNEHEKSLSFIQKILEQNIKTIALVSDAGTPAISDPGAIFITHAHKHGIQVLNVPGPSSLVCALAASGFSHPRHVFSGFLSRNTKKQKEEFERWVQVAPCIGVFFESPQRILSTIKHLSDFFHPQTRICLSREISKKFEENIVLSLQNAYGFLEAKQDIRGEFVVCVEVLPTSQKTEDKKEIQSLKQDCKILAEKYNISAKELYSFIGKHRIRDDSSE